MPKVSKETAAGHEDVGPVENWTEDLPGGYTVDFLTFRADMDATPLLKGLPNDECHCTHFGYVLKGRLTYRVGDDEMVVEAGEAFMLTPGHVPVGNEPGTEFIQFSPTKEVHEVGETIMRNFEAMQAGASA